MAQVTWHAASRAGSGVQRAAVDNDSGSGKARPGRYLVSTLASLTRAENPLKLGRATLKSYLGLRKACQDRE